MVSEPARRFDKMKRRSESLGGESSDRSQLSDDENSALGSAQLVSASALLEQVCSDTSIWFIYGYLFLLIRSFKSCVLILYFYMQLFKSFSLLLFYPNDFFYL